jgi:antitoxin (DNA-binding transcriptional repressor) of toxin-antitoxin stability system
MSAMKEIAAATFKEECLTLLDHVDPDGIVITKGGKPIAKLIPVGSDSAVAGSIEERNKIRSQMVPTGIEWGC